ncbi:MAG: helix-turn-helix domain-containing protein [Chitinophagaceae bacterium]
MKTVLHQVYIPHPALREFVVSFITVDAVLTESMDTVVTPYPPAPHQSFIFYGDHSIKMKKEGSSSFELQPSIVVVGPQFTRVNLMVMKRLKAVRVDFHPGGLYRLLRIPMTHLYDGGFDAFDVIGNEIRSINQQLLDAPDMELSKNIVENFLLKKIKNLKEALPFDGAMRQLLLNDGNIPIEKIASLACLSLRQFERKCTERIGIPPKAFARIARFSKAYRIREAKPDLTWTAIAYEAGYFDQMHLIRDFKEFAGVTPRIIEEALAGTPFRMQAHLRV